MEWVGEPSDENELISRLPENVIHNILMLLPIKDAARTALLSSTWRRHWRSIPQLVFDDGFAPTEPNDKLVPNIYKSLLARDGPVIKFVLAVPGLNPCHEIDHIIVHLSGIGVLQHFTLVLSSKDSHSHSWYRLPSSLFAAPRLNYLKLERCLFVVPPWFVGFGQLKKLRLIRVNVPSDFCENFLPKCPLLASMLIVSCTGLEKLELDAPRLKLFNFEGEMQKLCFKRTPCLSVLRLSVYGGLQNPDLAALLASLRVLERFVVASESLEVFGKGGHVSTRLPSPHCRLKTLCIYLNVITSLGERILVFLISSAPNLHKLVIQCMVSRRNQLAYNLATSIGTLLEAAHRRGPCLQHLRVFAIEDGLGAPLELELVRFILATAPNLLRVEIKPSFLLCSRKVFEFMKEVMRYKRISKEAQVLYDYSEENHSHLCSCCL
ncbi:unnamed protein product [Linum tenue]|uniref:F-box domain-containing protein n=1 Tax=Linum tenue TaxID=586396 RepID=A0AAV0NIT1_9ROSI|nr:unnamed protein product [Linum tenue]